MANEEEKGDSISSFRVSPTDVTSALGKLLEDSVVESQRLINSLKQSPPRDDHRNEAVRLSRKLRNDSLRLKNETSIMINFVESAPNLVEIVSTASPVVGDVKAILDCFETFLQSKYGILKVENIGQTGKKDSGTTNCPQTIVSDGNINVSNVPKLVLPVDSGFHSESKSKDRRNFNSTPKNYERTPSKKVEAEAVVDAVPVTPTLGDFGISSEDLDGLQKASVFYPCSTAANHTPVNGVRQKKSEETVDELVNRSIAALQIETPAEVAERFQNVSNYGDGQTPHSSRKQLNFDLTTPETSFPPLRTRLRRLGLSASRRP